MTKVTAIQLARAAQQFHAEGRLAEAEGLYRKALGEDPQQAEAMCGLGILSCQAGRHDEALRLLRPDLVARSKNPLLNISLAASLHAKGRDDEALGYAREALALDDQYPDGHNVMGSVLFAQGQVAQAEAAYRRATALNQRDAEMQFNLGTALQAQGKDGEAVGAYRAGLALKPDDARILLYLGLALRDLKDFEGFDANFHRLEGVRPPTVESLQGMSMALAEKGRIEEAMDALRKAVDARPGDAMMHSSLVYMAHLHPDSTEESIAGEAGRWNQHHAAALLPAKPTFANDRSPARRLRVGYVSPDFFAHAECRFILPLFGAHDRGQVEVHAYSSVRKADEMTQLIRTRTDCWHEVRSLSDAALADKIRADGMDILVDLTMHTMDNRLLTFARRPAPVQMSWLAYPGRTGLSAMDFRITDVHLDPPGLLETGGASERALRLPDGWCCYQPVDDAPAVNGLPALETGYITFGSLNSFRKMSERVMEMWGDILRAVPGSRLIMTCPRGDHRGWVESIFARRGVEAGRVRLAEPTNYAEYLRQYQAIDMALDPLPHNGLTTTCDALWMGVPVLSLVGRTHVGRAGLSLLTTVGLGEWVAGTREELMRKAVEFSGDLPGLAALRAGMRERLRASPLLDAKRFARNLELAYRTAWEMWCRFG